MCRRRSSDWGAKGLATQRAIVYTALTRARSKLYLLLEDFRWEWVHSWTERQQLGNQLWRKIAEVSEQHIRMFWGQEPQWLEDATDVVRPWFFGSRIFQEIQGMQAAPANVFETLSREYAQWQYVAEPLAEPDAVLFKSVDVWRAFLATPQLSRRLQQPPRGLEQYGWRSETVQAAPDGVMQFWGHRLIQAVTITYRGGEGYILQLPVLRPEHRQEDVARLFLDFWRQLLERF